MKKLIAVLFVMVMLSGCATYQVSQNPNATAQEKLDAKNVDCKAAGDLIEQAESELAQLMKADVLDQDAVRYWTAARSGARLGMTLAGCPITKPTVGK